LTQLAPREACFVASRSTSGGSTPKLQASNHLRRLEPPMNIRLHERVAILALAVLVNLAVFGAIDHLAVPQGQQGVWASAAQPARS
jgi:hypothetical protein